MPKYNLTAKQARFCEEYLVDLNGTQAAIRAGYSKKTANRMASENLSKPDIQLYIKELMEEQSKRTELTADMVIAELKNVAFADTKLQGRDKVRALELLGQHLGMFTEKVANVKEDEIPKLLEALKG